MADDVEEKDEEDWSEALVENPKSLETSKNTSKLEVSPSKNPELPVEPTAQILQSTSKVNTMEQDKVSFQPNPAGEKVENHSTNPGTPNPQKPFKSDCHPRSRDVRQCQKHIQDIIGKHEMRNEELEQLEGDLRQRLQALESSMPAVMVWNIWRMAQGAPNSAVRRLMEKQFKGFGADNVPVPTTPSQHWDERVRKIEAERKEAVRRAEEARTLLAGKEAAVYERKKRLEEAKKCHLERKEMMEKLAREAAKQREALKNARGDDNSGESGQCGEKCKEKWLGAVGSVSSIGSTDLESFGKLQELAEAEICMKRQISELERREEAYMRTLQQADEMWSKMEGDKADTVSLLQDQLDLKTTANQQLADRICQLEDELENSRKKLISSKEALSKFTSKVFTEAKSGYDDSEADVKDRGILAAVKTAPASATAGPETFDQESLAHPEKTDKESHIVAPEKSHVGITAVPKTSSKTSEAVPVPVDQTHRGVDPVTELKADAIHRGVDPVTELKTDEPTRGVAPVSQMRMETPVGDEENIPEHWKNWNWDEGCPPDIICDDMVESATGTGECKLDAGSKSDQIAISSEELRNWYNIVDSLHHMIAKGDDCSSKNDDVAQLAAKMKSHLRMKGVAGVKGPMIIPEKILKPEVFPSGEHKPGAMVPSVEEMTQSYIPEDKKEIDTKRVPLAPSIEKMKEEIKTEILTDHIDLHDETKPHVPKEETKIGEEISLVTPTEEEVRVETMPEVSIDHVAETEPQVPEVIGKISEEIGPLTPTTEKIQQEIKPETLTDHVQLPDETGPFIPEDVAKDIVDETKSTILEEVVKTDKDISPLSAGREETEPSDVLVPLEKAGIPEAEDVALPAESAKTTDISATPVPRDVETKTSEIVDEIPDVVTPQIDVSEKEPAFADEQLPVSTAESPRVEKEAEDLIVAHLEDVKVKEEPAEIPYEDSSYVAPIETVKKSEHELPDTEGVKVEPVKMPISEKAKVQPEEMPILEEVKVEPEKITDSEKVEAESEVIPDAKKVEIEPEVIPDAKKVEIEPEVIPDAKKVEIEPEVIQDAKKVEIEPEVIPVSEKVEVEPEGIPVSEKVETEEIAEAEKIEVEHEIIADAGKVEVEPVGIPDSEKVEVESEEILEPSEMVSPAESVYTSAEEFSEPEFDTSVVADEPLTITDLEKEPTHIPEGETLIEIPEELAEEAKETIPVSKDDGLEYKDAVEAIEQVEEFTADKGEAEAPLELEVPAEEDLTIEEAPPSFITPRTPPLSKIDVRKESKDEILAVPDLRDDQSALDVVREKRSSEVIVGEELEELLSKIGDVPIKVKETMPELDIREPVPVVPEEPEKVSITKTIDYVEPPAGIPELEFAISKAEVAVKADSETMPEILEVGSQPDVKETERPEDKLIEDIPTKEKITVDRPKAGKPYLVIAKVESWKELESKPTGPCICKPRICPLLGRSAGRRPKLKVVEVVTSGTQTILTIPKTLLGRMDKQKPKKLPESTRPAPVVAMWRRATISPRRPKDKSTLTTVCVDTQTDSTLVRGRIALQGITRKDDCTCSGACPRKPDHGGCIHRISNRPTGEKRPAPVSLATAQLFSSTNFPTSMTSCAEKEICVVKYTGTSFVSSGSHLECIECGRPITPGGTVVSTKSTLPTAFTSQKSMMKSPKSMESSTSRVTHSKDGLTCGACKTSAKLKTDDGSKSKTQGRKDLDKRRHDQDVCCPCPPKVAKKTSSKLSKKKRKPEMKDQAVMANIPKTSLKASSKEAKDIDVIKKKSPYGTSSRTKPSDTGTKTVPKILVPGKESICSCDESSHELTNADGVKTPKDDDPCNCFLMESVSKGSSCNCFNYNV